MDRIGTNRTEYDQSGLNRTIVDGIGPCVFTLFWQLSSQLVRLGINWCYLRTIPRMQQLRSIIVHITNLKFWISQLLAHTMYRKVLTYSTTFIKLTCLGCIKYTLTYSIMYHKNYLFRLHFSKGQTSYLFRLY